MNGNGARQRFVEIQQGLLVFLRAYEAEQEQVLFKEIRASQERLTDAAGDFFETEVEDYYLLAPAAEAGAIHGEFCEVLSQCAEAYRIYRTGRGVKFNAALLESRLILAGALEKLYQIRDQLPLLTEFWFISSAAQELRPALENTTGEVTGVGIQHRPAALDHGEYSLYVPETYSKEKDWPLILCLHGGYGQAREFLWTWMRPAISAGYLVVAPKSLDLTWSILNPPRDIDSIASILHLVCREYRVDRKKVFLTGLSDGATFSYLLAFLCPELFAGVAPVAGEMHEIADDLVRQGAAKQVPFYVVHGALDHIFPVETQRSTCDLLQRLGYQIRYDELPDWGHAYPYQINEQRLLPWFEHL